MVFSEKFDLIRIYTIDSELINNLGSTISDNLYKTMYSHNDGNLIGAFDRKLYGQLDTYLIRITRRSLR